MWAVLGMSVLAVVAPVGTLALFLLLRSPYLAYLSTSLLGCAYVSMFVGGACGLVLTAVLDEGSPARVVATVIAIVLLAGGVLITAELLREMWLTGRRTRRDERS
jgi:hypothetical protein